MATLKFRFNLDKLVNALAFFADAGIGDLTKLKAAKLLYLADQRHLFKFGRPITGDRYIAMDLGPVPESAYQLIGRLSESVPDLDVFSDSEIEVLKGVVADYGSVGASDLVRLTHQHGAYQRADAGRAPGSIVELPYDYFFDDAPADSEGARTLADNEQADRAFAEALDAAGRRALTQKRHDSQVAH